MKGKKKSERFYNNIQKEVAVKFSCASEPPGFLTYTISGFRFLEHLSDCVIYVIMTKVLFK